MERLLPLLAPGLKVVFVGTSPGQESLRTGNYYANPRNAFYGTLFASGFTSRRFSPEEHRDLLAIGIGLDDVYDDPKAAAASRGRGTHRGVLQQQGGTRGIRGTGPRPVARSSRLAAGEAGGRPCCLGGHRQLRECERLLGRSDSAPPPAAGPFRLEAAPVTNDDCGLDVSRELLLSHQQPFSPATSRKVTSHHATSLKGVKYPREPDPLPNAHVR